MKTAMNVHAAAGQGNGSVLTQNQPVWSSSASSIQSCSSSSSSSSSTVSDPRRCSTWGSRGSTAERLVRWGVSPPDYSEQNEHMSDRDVAIVLSGGGMNGMLLELGFLKRLRESSLWPRVGWIYGTSAGALAGTMAALDRLEELEEFTLGLQPSDIFRPQRLWRLPLNGLHEYALPATIAERLLDPNELADSLAEAPIEVIVFATDVSEGDDGTYELAYSSHETPPETMA